MLPVLPLHEEQRLIQGGLFPAEPRQHALFLVGDVERKRHGEIAFAAPTGFDPLLLGYVGAPSNLHGDGQESTDPLVAFEKKPHQIIGRRMASK